MAAALFALDLLLGDAEPGTLSSWLTTPVLRLNALELVVVALVSIVAARLFPPAYRRIRVRQRARRFYANWQEFKRILGGYRDSEPDALQDQYAKLLGRLQRDYSFFAPMLIRIRRSFPHGEYAESGVNNLGTCFRAAQLAECCSQVRKKWPDGVDCFDHMFLALIEHGASVVPLGKVED